MPSGSGRPGRHADGGREQKPGHCRRMSAMHLIKSLKATCMLLAIAGGTVVAAQGADTFAVSALVRGAEPQDKWPAGLQRVMDDVEEAAAREDHRFLEPWLDESWAAGGPRCRSEELPRLKEWGSREWRALGASVRRGVAVVGEDRAVAPFTVLSLPADAREGRAVSSGVAEPVYGEPGYGAPVLEHIGPSVVAVVYTNSAHDSEFVEIRSLRGLRGFLRRQVVDGRETVLVAVAKREGGWRITAIGRHC
jgi:hypothetical protein